MSKEQTLEEGISLLLGEKTEGYLESLVSDLQSLIRSKQKEAAEKTWDAAVKWNEEQWSGGPIGYTPALDKKQFLSHYNTNEDEPNGNKV